MEANVTSAMSDEPQTCEVCGARLPANAPGEPCPACLVRSAIGQAGSSAPEGEMEPGETKLSLASAHRFKDYELLEEIARGGMGVVYRARQIGLNRLVAVKILLAAEFANETSRERFRREAEAVASLSHPNIISIYEVGEHEGLPYFSMELIEGRSLADLTREKPVPARQAAKWLKTIAEAVQYAHQHGVLHRDLKPSNVLMDGLDEPHVTDFGLAKTVKVGPDLTQTGQVLGTPSYMPPEQADPKRGGVTAASDVYSLGAILYHLLTARAPFMAETLTQTLRLVLECEPVSPRSLNPGTPQDLETICIKCLDKDPNRRYATAQHLAHELGRFLGNEPILARPISATARFSRWCRRKPALSATGAAACLAVVLGFSGVLWQWRTSEKHRLEARLAERETRQELRHSYLAQARAHRWSPQAGRRFESLAALAKAAEIRPDEDLRNEAIACMVLPDLRLGRQWPGSHVDSRLVTTDASVQLRTGCNLNREIFVRRLTDDQLVRQFEVTAERVWFVRLSPDGRLIAAEFARPNQKTADLLCVWSVESGAKIWELPGGISQYAFDFSPDSRSLAVADPAENIIILDLTDGSERGRFLSQVPPYSLHFSPDGQQLAVCSHHRQVVEILDAQTGAVRTRLPHPGTVRCAEWHPGGGMLATACQDLRVYVWDVARTQQLAVLQGHTVSPEALAFNHAGDLLASGGPHDRLYLWEPLGAGLLVKLTCSATSLKFSPDDNRIIAMGGVPELSLVEVARPKERRLLRAAGSGPFLPSLTSSPASAVFSTDGRMLATLDHEGARLWDAETGRPLLFVHFPEGFSILLHPDGRTLIGSGAEGLHRWSLNPDWHGGGTQWRVARAEDIEPGNDMRQAALSPDGQHLAVRRNRGIQLLRLDGGQRSLLPLRSATYESVGFSPDGKWLAATACPEEGAKVWRVATCETAEVLPGSDTVNLSFSPDGHWLVGCSFEEYRFMEVGTWKLRRTISRIATGRSLGPIVLNRDGTLMAAPMISSSGVQLLQTNSGQQLAVLDDWDHYPVCFSPGGGELVTLASNGRYYIWDLVLIRRQLGGLKLDWGGP